MVDIRDRAGEERPHDPSMVRVEARVTIRTSVVIAANLGDSVAEMSIEDSIPEAGWIELLDDVEVLGRGPVVD